jgi:plastocyanin
MARLGARGLLTAASVVALSCSASIPPHPADAGATLDAGGPIVLVGPAADHSFQPAMLVVPVGTTVQWFWESAGHNLISGLEGTPDGRFCAPSDADCSSDATAAFTLAAGTIYLHTFTTPGTYPYYCAPHVSDGMKGTIVVQ